MRSQAQDAVLRAQRIVTLREEYRAAAATIASNNAMTLVDLVCDTPIVSSRAVESGLGVTRPTALKLLRELEKVGVLVEGDAGPRGQRRYLARELMTAPRTRGGGGRSPCASAGLRLPVPYTVGGAERWYRSLAERLAREGHDVTYLTLRQWDRGERSSSTRGSRWSPSGRG